MNKLIMLGIISLASLCILVNGFWHNPVWPPVPQKKGKNTNIIIHNHTSTHVTFIVWSKYTRMVQKGNFMSSVAFQAHQPGLLHTGSRAMWSCLTREEEEKSQNKLVLLFLSFYVYLYNNI